MGITSGVKGYPLWCPITKKIIFTIDVIFNESAIVKQKDSEKDDKPIVLGSMWSLKMLKMIQLMLGRKIMSLYRPKMKKRF